MTATNLSLLLWIPFLTLACGEVVDDVKDSQDTGGSDSADTEDTEDTEDTAPAPLCEDPVEPPCVDAMILELSLHDDKVSNGAVATSLEGEDFVTSVDASAGGMSGSTRYPWVYVRLGADGAERVDIDDESALESMDWHIAFRRFNVRLNGGDGGPSCVGADARNRENYAEITSVPADASYALEDFYDDACELQMDTYGMSPDFALYGWWEYGGSCVQTTLLPFLLQLDDGRVLKFVIEAYYESGQEACNENGTAGEGSGVLTFRWRDLTP